MSIDFLIKQMKLVTLKTALSVFKKMFSVKILTNE